MRRLRYALLGIALAGAAAALAFTFAPDSRGGSPHAASRRVDGTWPAVADVLSTHCVSCHTNGGIAPFSLTSAASAKLYARDIVRMTQAHLMPPWPPGTDSPQYLGESRRVLTSDEMATLTAWVHDGTPAPAGAQVPEPSNAGDAAPGRAVTLAPAASYTPHITSGATDDYHCFLIDPKLTQDEFITSAKVQPGDPGIVHHVILFEARGQQADAARQRNAASGGRGWSCFGDPGIGEDRSSGAFDRLGAPPWLAAWAPGAGTTDMPPGTGVPLHAGSLIVMQVHYNLLHGTRPDRSSVVLHLVPASGARLIPLETTLVAAPVELPCPSGAKGSRCSRATALADEERKYGYAAAQIPLGLLFLCGKTLADYPQHPRSVTHLTTSCARPVTRPIRIYGVGGHMHLRGLDIRVTLDPGTAHERLLLHIPHWDFHWQGGYYFTQPVDAGPGDTLGVSCTFDNSAANQPVVNRKTIAPRYVLWGEGTTDEMCLAILQVANR